MHSNKYWLGFLMLITLAMVWFTWQTIGKTTDYYTLSNSIDAATIAWSPIKKGDDHYLLSAEYTFHVNNQNIHKKEVLSTPVYPNPWAVEQAASKQNTKQWKVWYSPDAPQKASLERNFPTKELVSMVILWGVWIYFVCLGFYVTRF